MNKTKIAPKSLPATAVTVVAIAFVLAASLIGVSNLSDYIGVRGALPSAVFVVSGAIGVCGLVWSVVVAAWPNNTHHRYPWH